MAIKWRGYTRKRDEEKKLKGKIDDHYTGFHNRGELLANDNHSDISHHINLLKER